MRKRIKLLLLLVSLSFTLSVVSTTYSRYVAGTTGNMNLSLTNWQVFVNENDIVSNTSSNVTVTPVIDGNTNVADNALAPTSTGYFDIDIDPTNVGLSFRYRIEMSIDNTIAPDVMISGYEILDETKVSNPGNIMNITGGVIENTLLFNKNITNYSHEEFTIRVYFEWYEGADNILTDEDDTELGTRTVTEDLSVAINATLSFEQVA